jgi:hypothetical protein
MIDVELTKVSLVPTVSDWAMSVKFTLGFTQEEVYSRQITYENHSKKI